MTDRHIMKLRTASSGDICELTVPMKIVDELKVKAGDYFDIRITKTGFKADVLK
jgi:CTP-dependent riboflavin kinase